MAAEPMDQRKTCETLTFGIFISQSEDKVPLGLRKKAPNVVTKSY